MRPVRAPSCTGPFQDAGLSPLAPTGPTSTLPGKGSCRQLREWKDHPVRAAPGRRLLELGTRAEAASQDRQLCVDLVACGFWSAQARLFPGWTLREGPWGKTQALWTNVYERDAQDMVQSRTSESKVGEKVLTATGKNKF